MLAKEVLIEALPTGKVLDLRRRSNQQFIVHGPDIISTRRQTGVMSITGRCRTPLPEPASAPVAVCATAPTATEDCTHKLLLLEGETNVNTVISETFDEGQW